MTSSLPERLKRDTQQLHTQAERTAFMRVLLRGEIERHAYCALLRNLQAIYAALEPALQRQAGSPAIGPLRLSALPREAALRSDLDALHGPGWREKFELQPATLAYVARLNAVEATRPALLVAHSYVRYLGDLSGGQMLARIVRRSLRLPDDAPGTAFYDFGDAEATARLKAAYREGLERVKVDEEAAEAIVSEAVRAFELHRQLFDELALRFLPSPPA